MPELLEVLWCRRHACFLVQLRWLQHKGYRFLMQPGRLHHNRATCQQPGRLHRKG